MVRLHTRCTIWRSCFIKLNIIVSLSSHKIRFSCFIAKQVPPIIDITHRRENCWNKLHIMFHIISVNYFLMQSARALLKRFHTHFHNMVSRSQCRTLTLDYVCIHNRPVVIANRHPSPKRSCNENIDSNNWILN